MHESTLRRDDTSDLHPLLHGLSEFFNLVQGAPTRGDLGVRVRVTSSTRLIQHEYENTSRPADCTLNEGYKCGKSSSMRRGSHLQYTGSSTPSSLTYLMPCLPSN